MSKSKVRVVIRTYLIDAENVMANEIWFEINATLRNRARGSCARSNGVSFTYTVATMSY